jgi:hypothetical protein
MNSGTEKIIKRTDPTYIFSFINKHINILNDINTSKKEKRDTMDTLYEFMVKEEPIIPKLICQEILISFNKNFIKLSLFDPIDRIREYALKILIQ